MPSDKPTLVLFLSSDLMFTSRVQATAAHCGILAAASPDRAKLLSAKGDGQVKLVVIDLNTLNGDLNETVKAFREQLADARIIAFGSHVLEDKLKAARDAGCDQVLTRGQFDQQMATIFQQLAGKIV